MIQDPDKLRSEFDYECVLSVKPIELGTVAQEKYKALFVQYFWFDVVDQQKVFYRDVQLFLRGLCETLLSEFLVELYNRLDLQALDPQAMFSRSEDRAVDYFMDCCLVLTRFNLLADDVGAAVLQQFKAASYFLQRWRNQLSECPVVDNVFNLWLSYPHWSRCTALLDVNQIVFCNSLRSMYCAGFLDVGDTALNQGQMLSSINSVRSWSSL